MMKYIKKFIFIPIIFLSFAMPAYSQERGKLHGTVTSSDNETIDFATVSLKGTSYGCSVNSKGEYELKAPAGNYTVIITAMGYEHTEKPVKITAGNRQRLDFVISPESQQIERVTIKADAVGRVKESAYNAVAIDTKSMHNTTLDLAGALAKAPGVNLRESGGVGSDTRFSLDGFSGKHIKFFIDGIPMDGGGSSFGINNIPVNFAERIEIYRGVVPVGVGADALGGVVNIVTGNQRRSFVDVSYSYGSFNTHKSYINAGHTTDKGFMFEVNAFQNYSDNSYKIYTAVKDFDGQTITDGTEEWVKRFHDTYHNEAIIAKIGLVGKSFADRLVLEVNLSQSYREIQNGVLQEVVFGEKNQSARSVMPSVRYRKRNLFTEGLDISFTANYNRNQRHLLDTATYIYNWRGEKHYTGTLGEQAYQDAVFDEDNYNATFNANYRIGDMHSIVLNHLFAGFERNTVSAAGTGNNSTTAAAFDKTSRKNITGLSYRIGREGKWNVSLFGKYYNQYSSGPRNQSTSGYDYVLFAESVGAMGYGAAGTWFPGDFQAKLSYEKALRLPSAEELFGDEDLELGEIGLKPERSDNFNLSLSYVKSWGKHSLYAEGGVIYRDTKDYIRRATVSMSGGKYFGQNVNHGNVKTYGFNAEVRYNYSDKLSLGGNITNHNIMDYEPYEEKGSLKESLSYRTHMPNIPYLFFGTDVSFYFRDFLRKGNTLSLTYDNLYVHKFPLRFITHGRPDTKKWIPSQFTHNINLTYSLRKGRYNISLECRNLTDERVYDNFSLQKAGRAFYVKLRYFFSK